MLGLKLIHVSKGGPGLLHPALETLVNWTCHPGGHYYDYYPGALLSVEGTASHLKIWYSPILSPGTNSSNFLQSQGWECTRIVTLRVDTWSPLYQHGLTLILAWINNYTPNKMWDEIAYPFLNLSSAAAEVWEWISNLISWLTVHVITYPWWD